VIVEMALASGCPGNRLVRSGFWNVLDMGRTGRKRSIVRATGLSFRWRGEESDTSSRRGMTGPWRPRGSKCCARHPEAETRVFIERMLNRQRETSAPGEKLAAECETTLDERIRAMSLAIGMKPHGAVWMTEAEENALWYAATLTERTRSLFDLAAAWRGPCRGNKRTD